MMECKAGSRPTAVWYYQTSDYSWLTGDRDRCSRFPCNCRQNQSYRFASALAAFRLKQIRGFMERINLANTGVFFMTLKRFATEFGMGT
ncbi:MAG: hypothetical protein KDJ67_01410, partial [Nitratireductor sp.]|nr:hypothetical protein [Nitratireductor sp.]